MNLGCWKVPESFNYIHKFITIIASFNQFQDYFVLKLLPKVQKGARFEMFSAINSDRSCE